MSKCTYIYVPFCFNFKTFHFLSMYCTYVTLKYSMLHVLVHEYHNWFLPIGNRVSIAISFIIILSMHFFNFNCIWWWWLLPSVFYHMYHIYLFLSLWSFVTLVQPDHYGMHALLPRSGSVERQCCPCGSYICFIYIYIINQRLFYSVIYYLNIIATKPILVFWSG